jgi:hypothetical protein
VRAVGDVEARAHHVGERRPERGQRLAGDVERAPRLRVHAAGTGRPSGPIPAVPATWTNGPTRTARE